MALFSHKQQVTYAKFPHPQETILHLHHMYIDWQPGKSQALKCSGQWSQN